MIDLLGIINHLRRAQRNQRVIIVGMFDANGDGTISAGDAVHIINHFRKTRGPAPSPETETPQEPNEPSENPTLDVSDEQLLEPEIDVADEADVPESDDSGDLPQSENNDEGGNESETPNDPVEEENDGEADSGHDRPHHHWLPRLGGGHFFHHVLGAIDPENLITRLDTNDDGGLNEDEVPDVVWQFAVDRQIDTNADGKITVPEIEAELVEFRDDLFDQRFQRRDDNGDDLLTENEVRDRVWRRISAADTDGDSAVSRDELKSWIEDRSA